MTYQRQLAVISSRLHLYRVKLKRFTYMPIPLFAGRLPGVQMSALLLFIRLYSRPLFTIAFSDRTWADIYRCQL